MIFFHYNAFVSNAVLIGIAGLCPLNFVEVNALRLLCVVPTSSIIWESEWIEEELNSCASSKTSYSVMLTVHHSLCEKEMASLVVVVPYGKWTFAINTQSISVFEVKKKKFHCNLNSFLIQFLKRRRKNEFIWVEGTNCMKCFICFILAVGCSVSWKRLIYGWKLTWIFPGTTTMEWSLASTHLTTASGAASTSHDISTADLRTTFQIRRLGILKSGACATNNYLISLNLIGNFRIPKTPIIMQKLLSQVKVSLIVAQYK